MTTTNRAATIAALNDALRHDPGTGEYGRIVMTHGVSELGIPFAMQALAKLKAFDAFTKGYPSGEGRLVKALETSPTSDVLS